MSSLSTTGSFRRCQTAAQLRDGTGPKVRRDTRRWLTQRALLLAATVRLQRVNMLHVDPARGVLLGHLVRPTAPRRALDRRAPRPRRPGQCSHLSTTLIAIHIAIPITPT